MREALAIEKPRALDLFCGAGGVTKGLQRAGFHVTGIDIKPQPRYCGDVFIQMSALDVPVNVITNRYDFVWASPPCQAHTAMKTMHNAKEHRDFIEDARSLLIAAGNPYCIENVEGAPLFQPFRLCGTSFGLGVSDAELRRHRLFETSFPVLAPRCQHRSRVLGVYGGHIRDRRRTIGVYGEGARDSRRKNSKGHPDFTVQDARTAMDIDWMTIAELCQAIPPAYSEFIARQFLSRVGAPPVTV